MKNGRIIIYKPIHYILEKKNGEIYIKYSSAIVPLEIRNDEIFLRLEKHR